MKQSERFYIFLEGGSDLTLRLPIDPRERPTKDVIALLQRSLRNRFGPAADGLRIEGFSWTGGRV